MSFGSLCSGRTPAKSGLSAGGMGGPPAGFAAGQRAVAPNSQQAAKTAAEAAVRFSLTPHLLLPVRQIAPGYHDHDPGVRNRPQITPFWWLRALLSIISPIWKCILHGSGTPATRPGRRPIHIANQRGRDGRGEAFCLYKDRPIGITYSKTSPG